MITISLPQPFSTATPYKVVQSNEKWQIINAEVPQEEYPQLVLRVKKQFYTQATDSEIERLFEQEHTRRIDEMQKVLDYSNASDVDDFSTFVLKGNRPTRRYLLIQE
jgi:hypothetical protein